jgi:hypothetical protein
MKGRVHQYLDGDRPLGSLSDEERKQVEQLNAVIAAATKEIRCRPVPDFAARVLAMAPPAPDPLPPGIVHKLLELLWFPVRFELKLRPVYGIALAGAAIVLALAAPLGLHSPGPEPTTGETAMLVQFRFEAPAASRVALAGSFTGWEPRVELRETTPGIWSVMVPLSPGVHDYTFVVDGTEWVPDPHAFGIDDSFGGTNSRLTLLAPSSDT